MNINLQMALSKNGIRKIRSWLGHARKRRWSRFIDVDKCINHAELILYKLGQK